MQPEELLVPFGPSRDQLATELRSTLLSTSLQTLKARALLDAYFEELPPEHHAAIKDLVAGVWMPIEVGMAHYRACDALGLTWEQIVAVGGEVGERVQGTVLGLMVRTAKTSGMSPWAGLRNCTLFYDRVFRGGGVSLVKIGPKEARVEVAGNPLCAIPYFRQGLRAVTVTGAQLFCAKAYSQELPRYTNSTSLGFRLSWA